MATFIRDTDLERQLISERQRIGADKYDEVWENVYMMAPAPNNEHQQIVMRLASVLDQIINERQLGDVLPGVNVTDRQDDWKKNYRVPDVAVFLKGGQAINRETHWYGGPDLAVEVISADDQAREKIPFYAKIGVQELLLIDRDPWQLELLRNADGKLITANTSTLASGQLIASEVVPLSFRLVQGKSRPQIEARSHVSEQAWLI
jgi:Uma2 family endonuclease